jgi:hypothetical protein
LTIVIGCALDAVVVAHIVFVRVSEHVCRVDRLTVGSVREIAAKLVRAGRAVTIVALNGA